MSRPEIYSLKFLVTGIGYSIQLHMRRTLILYIIIQHSFKPISIFLPQYKIPAPGLKNFHTAFQ